MARTRRRRIRNIPLLSTQKTAYAGENEGGAVGILVPGPPGSAVIPFGIQVNIHRRMGRVNPIDGGTVLRLGSGQVRGCPMDYGFAA
ncbi:penicillin-binding protein 2 [Methylocaldum marinum]|uniref:Penicillin-binding protein 2 n=1 Tax=Methylocaldum marinum TaxID=1432792 RepID=A0A250KYX8_9GAMM|nr:penicillin-binding protein 2 [Methylocaldum marinum]